MADVVRVSSCALLATLRLISARIWRHVIYCWHNRAPLDIANFALVPVRYQLLVGNFGCFLESIMLSFVKSHGV